MIERMAKAMAANLSIRVDLTPGIPMAHIEGIENAARAALEAAVEPTEKMLGGIPAYHREDALRFYRAMIRAELEP